MLTRARTTYSSTPCHGLEHARRPIHVVPCAAALTVQPGSIRGRLTQGRWTRSVFKKLCLGDAATRRAAGGLAPHLLILVEAQARFIGGLHDLARNCSRESAACQVEVVGAAAWTHDGTVAFSSNRDPRGAYAGSQYQKGQREVNSVPAIDFGAYLRRTLHHADNVFLKLDVEAGVCTVGLHVEHEHAHHTQTPSDTSSRAFLSTNVIFTVRRNSACCLIG